MSKPVKSLLKYRNKTITSLDEAAWVSTCSECETVKPIKTRHCSICNRCVFHLDHHSPWVNNCIGLENQRFYLLFILYSMLGVFYNLFSVMSIWNHYMYKDNAKLMNFIFVLDLFLTVVLVMLNMWHWALAMTGMLTADIVCGAKVILNLFIYCNRARVVLL